MVTDFDRDLVRLLGDERATDAARARARERNLRASALTDATLAGVLLDIAERRDRVSIRTAFGRDLRGHIAVVARDGIVLESVLGVSYLRFDAIASFRRVGAAPIPEPSGDRPPPRAATLAALLADLAAEHPRVAVAITGERGLVTGELRAVGRDIMTVMVCDDAVYVAAAQVSELTVLASG